MPAHGDFFLPPSVVAEYQRLYLSPFIHYQDALGSLIRLSETAEFRKYTISHFTGAQLEIYRIYPESIVQFADEFPLDVYSLLSRSIPETCGIKLIVDPSPHISPTANHAEALPCVISLLPYR